MHDGSFGRLHGLEPPHPTLDQKLARLEDCLRALESVVIAFSGGVDSTFLAVAAHRVLGDKALAVTAVSPSLPQREQDEACQLATLLGLPHRLVTSGEMENPDYVRNPRNRCYHCKSELFGVLRRVAEETGHRYLLDGAVADDATDYRPGQQAAKEAGVRSLLQETGFTKDEVRIVSRAWNLPTADKPAQACLASRFPYGHSLSPEALGRVEAAENALHDLGFKQIRVRVHHHLARIECDPNDLERLVHEPIRTRITHTLKQLGYHYIALDLQGYRTGSLNEVLDHHERASP